MYSGENRGVEGRLWQRESWMPRVDRNQQFAAVHRCSTKPLIPLAQTYLLRRSRSLMFANNRDKMRERMRE
jgi:hypothetical protein